MASDPASSSKASKLYFGYGSNLWLYQMRQRCPTSTYKGVACLSKYLWIINGRGYANVVEQDKDDSYVYGMVYDLLPTDESRLDRNEGVPIAYTKEFLDVDFWEGDVDKDDGWVDIGKKPTKKSMLVYIDRKKVKPDEPKKEYIHRMNEGIRDAIKVGVPEDYVDKYMRKYIPDESDDALKDFAHRQALNFEDENEA